MNSDLTIFASFLGAALAGALGVTALICRRTVASWRYFGLGLLLLAADTALGGIVLDSNSLVEALSWQRARLLVAAVLPGVWLTFAVCYSCANGRESLLRWRRAILGLLVIPALVAFGFPQGLVHLPGENALVQNVILLGTPGKMVQAATLLGSILVLLNLERTFRSAVGIMRWRVKYLIFGAAILFGAKIYASSQALLYSALPPLLLQINGIAVLVAGLLMAFSLSRTRLGESEIYPSQKVLQNSITIIVAGVYLLIVGGMAKVVVHFGGDPSFPLKAFWLMLSLICLSVLVLSDRVQQHIKLLVARHFNRPAHDHRKVWATCTERTLLLTDAVDLSRAVVKLISETFELLSVTVWLAHDNKRSLRLGASTSLTAEQAVALLNNLQGLESSLIAVQTLSGPFDLDSSQADFARDLRRLDPDHFRKGGQRVCVPLVSGGELVGLITVADRVNGRSFSVEDLDLLACIGNQIAGTLRNLEMSRALIQNKEIQAFQAMSAFFVHDLKNTASTLSLMLENLKKHFGDPDFREDCLRSLGRRVMHIDELIKRLADLRHEMDLKPVQMDLNAVLSATIQTLPSLQGSALVEDLQPMPQIFADPEQLQKVFTNLLLNAREAVNGQGEIRVATAQQAGWAQLSISDNGCGMTREFMDRSLFRPFQSSKKNGLGIGMFHTKTIVEAHKGRIEVESQPGKGTTFRVLLPIAKPFAL